MNAILGKGLLVVVAAAAALFVGGCAPTRLLPSDYDQTSPATKGTTVVWEDSRNEETAGTDVYMYDTGSETEQLVAGGQGDQDQPAVSDSYIAWLDDGRLRAKNRSSGQVISVTTGPGPHVDPVLCGSVVAWTESRNGSSNVYARDLAGGSEIGVATSSATEAYPDCDAGRVVYMRSSATEWAGIRLYDVSSGQTTTVTDKSWNEWRPAISGNRVVWQAWPNQADPSSDIQIRGKDLNTGDSFDVTNGPGNQTSPVISGSVVAWEDARDPETRMWWRDLATTTAEKPTDTISFGAQQAPALSGRGLVYQSNPTGAWNVYQIPLLRGT